MGSACEEARPKQGCLHEPQVGEDDIADCGLAQSNDCIASDRV